MSGRNVRSAGLIGLATIASRLLGLVRDMAQAAFFATGPAADAFNVATRIPQLLRDLFAEGAMSAALVPTLTRTVERDGRAAAWRLGSLVINGLALVTGVLVVLGMVFAEPLTTYYGRNYADTPGKLELTIELTRINMPFLLLIAVAAACMGMLNAVRRFAAPAAAPAFYNVVFIACTLIGVPAFTALGIQPVMALSMGMLLGGVAQIALQWPALGREGYRHQWILNFNDPGLREVLRLMVPGTLGVAAAQINLLINTYLATKDDGAVSALGYAFRLMYMPIGIFGVSIATAAIPDLAKFALTRAFPEMRATLSWGVRLMLMLCVPATVGLMVLSVPITDLIFNRGAWEDRDTNAVAWALFCYAPGIVGYSIVKIASPSFYSLQESRTPAIISVISIAANLALSIWLHRVMGFKGLALGTALAANINAALLLVLLGRRIGGIEAGRILVATLKILAASAVMAVVAHWSHIWLTGVAPWKFVQVFGAIGIAMGALALAAWALRVDEFGQAMSRVFKKLKP